MRYLSQYENFKVKNITNEDVINCIKGGGFVFSSMVKDNPKINEKDALRPVSIDEDGLVTIEFEGKEYEVDLKKISKIDIPNKLHESFTVNKKSDNFIIVSSENLSKENELVRDDILENIEDILSHFEDNDFSVKVGYDYPDKGILSFNIGGKVFKKEDVGYISLLNTFLLKEGFNGVGNNILNDVDISFKGRGRTFTYPISRILHNISNSVDIDWMSFKYNLSSSIKESLENRKDFKYKEYRNEISRLFDKFETTSLYIDDFNLIKYTPLTSTTKERYDLDKEVCEYLISNLESTESIQSELLEVIEDAKDAVNTDVDVKLLMAKPIGLYKDKNGNPGVKMWANEECQFDILIDYKEGSNLRSISKLYNLIIDRLENIGTATSDLSKGNNFSYSSDNLEIQFKIVFSGK